LPRFSTTRANARLDGRVYAGQRSSTFRFDLVDIITGYRQAINPIVDGTAGISHDTRTTIKRKITGLQLGVADTAAFNSITSRLEPFMIINDEEFALGRYVPADWAKLVMTRGDQSVAAFYDEGFIIDQQIPSAFGASEIGGENVGSMLQRFISDFPNISVQIEQTSFTTLGSWGAGTRGGFILDQLALDGDFLSPWFDNESVLQLKRTFDPARALPNFDFDDNVNVLRENIIVSNNLITLPNRFVVISNGADALSEPIVGSADVPSSAPHSIANRGFIIASVSNRQIQTDLQANAVASALVQRQALIEETELDTLPDPRHDSYDIIRWQGENWIEVAWTLPFTAGAAMSHIMQRTYS
jgi:hypothetical protein